MYETLRKGLLTAALGVAGCGMMAASVQTADAAEPITNPKYADSANIQSDISAQWVWNALPNRIKMSNGEEWALDGHMNVVNVQMEHQLDERMSLVLNQAWLDINSNGSLAGEDIEGNGYSNLTVGLKYAIYPTQIEELTNAFRMTVDLPVGDKEVFRDGRGNVSPALLSTYEMNDGITLNGTLGATLPLGYDQSTRGYMNVGAAAEVMENVTSHLELNWFHVITEGTEGEGVIDGTPAPRFEGGDFVNWGSPAADEDPNFVSAALGLSCQLTDDLSMGVAYQQPLTTANRGLMDERVTTQLSMKY